MPYSLTPADIMDLRASVRWRLTDPISNAGVPFICYCREDNLARNAPGYDPEAFAIHTQGHLRAISHRLEVLGECLRQEWARPGFMIDIMDSRLDCTQALLDPASQEALRSRQAWEAKAAREYAAEEARRVSASRRATPKPPAVDLSTINPEDIFDD